MFRKMLIALLLVIAGVLGYAATRPDTFQVQRSIVIAAPPQAIYARIEDFRRWRDWSPWERLDPAMVRTHSGAARGVGAVYAWQGNREVGRGRMEVVAAAAPSTITIQLDFIEPFASRNITEFVLAPVDGGTRVIWTMRGENLYVSKLMGVFVDMDAMIGKDFARGLATLKSASER